MLKELEKLCNYGADIVYTGTVPVKVKVVNGVLLLNRRDEQSTDKKLAIFDNKQHGATALLDENGETFRQSPGDTEKYYSVPQHLSGIEVSANSNYGFTFNGIRIFSRADIG